MPKRGGNISLTSYDDIFETDESRAESQLERVQNTLFFIVFPSECFSGRRDIFRLGLRFDCRWVFARKSAKIGGR